MIIDDKQPPYEKDAPAGASAIGTLTTSGLLQDSEQLESEVPLQSPKSLAGPPVKPFYIELPTSKPIYTINSTVSGIVHLNRGDLQSIQEIQVSLVCSVRSRFHKYRGGNSQEAHRETVKLFHRDQSLWSRRSVDDIPPSNLPFAIRIPESGIDLRVHNNNVPLPPSFYAERVDPVANMIAHARLIGFVKYYVKARLIRKGFLKLNQAVSRPFIFLPPSASPPLLPVPPENISDQELDQLTASWTNDAVSNTIRQSIFTGCQGRTTLSLWLPRVEMLPRQTTIPFFLCLHLRTDPSKFQDQPPGPFLSTLPRLDKASVYLHQKLQICARRYVQVHPRTYDQSVTDNFVHSITPQESDWKRISDSNGSYWEKGYLWRGCWKFSLTPNFTNRQLTLKYFLVAKVPIKGLGNDIMLISKELDINTDVLADQLEAPGPAMAVEPELPPGYFELNAASDEDEDDYPQEKT